MFCRKWATKKIRDTPSSIRFEDEAALKTKTNRIENEKSGTTIAVYEHPYIVRLCHWANTISLFVLIGSGLQIFRAFPSFGSKVPQTNLIDWPRSLAIGGWLGGALQWHLTFMWIYLATGVIYLGYHLFSGHYRQVLFTHRDFAGVWPMVRRYFLFGPKPQQRLFHPCDPNGPMAATLDKLASGRFCYVGSLGHARLLNGGAVHTLTVIGRVG